MAAPAPPPAHPAPVQASLAPRGKRRLAGVGSLFRWVNTKGCSHALKLRHSFKVDPRMRVELGADLDIVDNHGPASMLRSASPWAAFWFQLDADDASKGTLEMNPLWIAVNRDVTLGRKGSWYEVPIAAKLGATYSGKPYVQVGIGNLPLALGLAAALLAAGKTVSVERKEVGNLAVNFSNGYSLHERVEVDARLQKEGSGLRLDLQQLNGVLRLRQE
ncbi:hypothetical protein ABPG77_000423 [Micractinium sp. CCAP 211/92]